MTINDLASKVAKFAETNKDGFTLCINTLKPITSGIAASYKATQNSFSETDLQSVISHALSHGGVVGGWYNSKDGKYYFDSNKVFKTNELAEAIQFGLNNEQIAIFDIDNLQEIRLDKQTKEYNFSTFADWFLNTANQVVEHYKGDILIDAKMIVELRTKHLFKSEKVEPHGFSFYWGLRGTGTWLKHAESDKGLTLSELIEGLGAKKVFFITFWYDKSKNEIITVQDIDKDSL